MSAQTKRRRAQYVIEGDHILWAPTKGSKPATWLVLSANTCQLGFVNAQPTRIIVVSNGNTEKKMCVPLGYCISVRTDMKDRNNSAITVSSGVRNG